MYATNLGESVTKRMSKDSYPKRRRSRGGSPRPTAASVVGECSDSAAVEEEETCGSSAGHSPKKEASLHLCESRSGTSRSDDAEPTTCSTGKAPKTAKKGSSHIMEHHGSLVSVEHLVTHIRSSVRPPPQPQSAAAAASLGFSVSAVDTSSTSGASQSEDVTKAQAHSSNHSSASELMNSSGSLYPVLGPPVALSGDTKQDEKLLVSAIDAKHESLLLPSSSSSKRCSAGTNMISVEGSELPYEPSSACAGTDPNRRQGTSNISRGTDGNLKRSSQSSSRSSRSVRWDSITIQMHQRELGDNPSCSASGPPLTLGWKPFQTRTLDLDSYEERRPERRQKEEMIAPPEQREVRSMHLHSALV